MTSVFTKMNLKDQREILVVNAPESFEPELSALQGVDIKRHHGDMSAVHYCVLFVTRQAEVDELAKAVLPMTIGDAQVWYAYPKGTSRKYRCEFNRDNGWAVVNELGFEGIRMVAIDEDWSALRFRRTEFIKR